MAPNIAERILISTGYPTKIVPESAIDLRRSEKRGVTATSFDVFDTCAVRRAGAPSDLYRVISQLLASRTGIFFDEDFAQSFVEARGEAERRAHRQSIREEPTLSEIWRQLSQLFGPDKLKGVDGPTLEMEAETLCPIESTRDRIARERALGRQILFISDTQHPGAFIEDWLRIHAFASANDHVYVSSEAGRTKRSGTLFRHVLEQEGLKPQELLHIGNDPIADFQVPGRLGIRTELFTLSRLEPLERLLLEKRPLNAQLWISTSAELKCRRLARPGSNVRKSARQTFVANFLGPFCCAFGHWVLNKAAADGVERLYFASRDARLLWPVCQTLARARNLSLDLRYLMVSRQALRLPLVSQLTPAEVPWLRESRAPATLPRLLGNFELPYDDGVAEWRRLRPDWKPEAALTTAMDWALFWRFLNLPNIRSRILELAAERRRHAKDYLGAQGMFDPLKIGYVDLGWFLGCQRGINVLRTEAGASERVKGYYLGLKRSRLGPAEAGQATALFYEHPDDTFASPHQAWLRRCYLLEQVVGIADHSSVKGYGSQGTVEFVSGNETVNPAHFQEIETALLDYTASFGECWKAMAQDESHLPVFLATLLRDFFDHPSGASVEVMREISFSFEQGAPNSEQLVAPYTWQEAFKACLPFSDARRVRASKVWPEASLQATPKAIRQVLQWANVGGRKDQAAGAP